jgi:segregation and condensation protein B
MTNEEVKRIIETLLFSCDKPLSIKELNDVLEDVDSRLLRTLLTELKQDYESAQRPISLIEIAGGFQLTTDPYYAPWVRKLFKRDRVSRLSMPALETVAIIAYRQPITRSEIEAIRGVNVDGVIHNLTERALIRTVGRKDAPGRPILYATTTDFLKHFGLNSLDELPVLKEFEEADIKLGEEQALSIEKGETDGTEQASQRS